MTIAEYVTQNYNHALLIYMQSGKVKGPLINTLQRGPSVYNIEKLADKLHSIGFEVPQAVVYSDPPQVEVPNEVNEPVETKPDIEPTPKMELNDEVTEGLMLRIKSLFKEQSFLHANKLDNDILPADEIKDACLRILQIDKEIQHLYAELKIYRETGQLPNQPSSIVDEKPLSQIDLHIRIQTLKKNISRDKNLPKRAKHVPKWEAELKQREIEYNAIINQ
jgi:hypothetical protein